MIRIITNKHYRHLIECIEALQEINNEFNKHISELNNYNFNNLERINNLEEENDNYYFQIKKLKETNKKLSGRIGGLTKQNNKLKDKCDVIDKAIEYIECALSEDKETPTKYQDWRLDLLEILKGGE